MDAGVGMRLFESLGSLLSVFCCCCVCVRLSVWCVFLCACFLSFVFFMFSVAH